jgi:hypothetical protein
MGRSVVEVLKLYDDAGRAAEVKQWIQWLEADDAHVYESSLDPLFDVLGLPVITKPYEFVSKVH